MFGQDRNEYVLPVHGVDESVGGLDASRQPGQPPRGDDDAPFVQHARKDDEHVVDPDCIVIFRHISLKTEERSWIFLFKTFFATTKHGAVSYIFGNGGQSIHMGTLCRKILSAAFSPVHVEHGAGLWNSGFVGGFEESLKLSGIRSVGQLSCVVEDAVEGLVPGQGRQQDQGGLAVGGLPAEPVGEFTLNVGDHEREVLHGRAVIKIKKTDEFRGIFQTKKIGFVLTFQACRERRIVARI